MFHKSGKIQGGLIALVAGAAAVAVLLAGLAFGATGAQAQATAGLTYGGPVDVLVAGTCGGGSITLTVGDDGASITELTLDGTYIGGVLVNTLSDPPGGPFVITLDPPIALENGAFSETFQPITGVDATLEGQFGARIVTGTFGVAALSCVDVPFSAEEGVVPPTSTPAPAPTGTPTAAAALPSTGSGAAGSGDSTALLVVLAAAAGVATLSAGFALRRRA